MKRKAYDTTKTPKTLLVAINAPYNKTPHIQSYYDEFLNLAETNQVAYEDVLYLKLRDIDPSTFLTEGKLLLVKEACDALNIEAVIFSEPLTPQQERNMSDFLGCKVYDRTYLILEIFEKAAVTAEGKTQVAIAKLQYDKTRLAGKGKELAQQVGAIGVRGGAGEKLIEKERRVIDQQIQKFKKQLETLHKARETQRKRRLRSAMPLISLVGYTNAGKSTILNTLTKSTVLAEDKLFATLDTTTRELYIDHTKVGLLSDTVGFIQMLPPRLVEAFKSTLSELQYADLLLHVIDISDPNWEEHIKVVHEILEDLELEKPILYIFNKADQIDIDLKTEIVLQRYQPHVLVSALSKQGLQPLLNYLVRWSQTS